ncbi:hypothetical protein A4S06_09335 [Erysipelotrichaceae bacterium MTC7]|nr:hypothetical protein A4S06_09335 [Erysipelotrichaceae bacterium MTC7]
MNKPSTLYEQLADNIKSKILDGELALGDRLPSERMMSVQYGINRMTVRKAIKLLEQERILSAEVGRGTFVSGIPVVSRKIELGENELISLTRQIRQKGLHPSREIISFQKIKTTEELHDFFPTSAFVYELVRLSLINGNPYALQKAYFPCNLFKDAERFDFVDESLYDYMEEQGHRPSKLVSYLKIAKIPDMYVSLFHEEKPRNVFLFDYFGFDKDHRLIEYTISYHLPEYTSFRYVTRKAKNNETR